MQAICSGVKGVGFEVAAGLRVVGACAGVAVIGFTVEGATVGTGVVGAFVIGVVVGGAPEIGEEIGADMGVAAFGSGVVGDAVGLRGVGAAVIGTVVGDVKDELLPAAESCRTTSTTTATTRPHANEARPKEIQRCWYHFTLT